MPNRQVVLTNAARDDAGQKFDLIFIDGGLSATCYLRANPSGNTPGIASGITSAGGIPIIAPSGGGDVVGIGTTGTIPLWTDGPNSIQGDSGLVQSGNNIAQALGNFTLTAGNLVLTAGTISFPSNVRQTFAPGATVPGFNVGSFAGSPSTPINGDLWYDSTANQLKARINGATASIGSGTITVGTTIIAGGATTRVLFDNAGVLGEYTISGTGSVAMTTSPTFTTPVLGVASATSLATDSILDGGSGNIVLTATSQVRFTVNGVAGYRFGDTVAQIPSGAVFNFGVGGADVGISRLGAAQLAIGSGAAGSFAGSLKLTGIINQGTEVQTSSSAAAFESGPNGSTNPCFRLVNNIASQGGGLEVTGLANGGGTVATPAGVQLRAIGAATQGFFLVAQGGGCIGHITGAGGRVDYSIGGVNSIRMSDVLLGVVSGVVIGFSSSAAAPQTTDSAFSRISAGLIGVGTGAAASFAGSLKLTDLFTNNATFLIRTNTTLTNNAAAQAATLLNAPTAGNPTKWFAIDDNGTTRFVPAW